MRTRLLGSSCRLFATLVTAAVALTAAAEAQRLPDLGDPDFDPEIDHAVQCITDTRVVRFIAEPGQGEPFEATTLSWQVDVPPGCTMRLSLAGKTIDPQGSLDVVPVHENNMFHLIAHIAGGTATLATTPVQVDISGCGNPLELAEGLIVNQVTPVIEQLDANDDDFRQTDPPLISIESNGLFIRLFLRTSKAGIPVANVQLDMLFRFIVRNGVINARYGLFRPNASTPLPDDFVESKFFDRADDILADFETAVNSRVGPFLPDDRQLFDVLTNPDVLTVIHCPVERPPARLTVRLRVLPQGDPGRFNLRVDGVTLAANTADGGSTGVREVSAGPTSSRRPPAAAPTLQSTARLLAATVLPMAG